METVRLYDKLKLGKHKMINLIIVYTLYQLLAIGAFIYIKVSVQLEKNKIVTVQNTDGSYSEVPRYGVVGDTRAKPIIRDSISPLAVYNALKEQLSKLPLEIPNKVDYLVVPLYFTLVTIPVILLPLFGWSKTIVRVTVLLFVFTVYRTTFIY